MPILLIPIAILISIFFGVKSFNNFKTNHPKVTQTPINVSSSPTPSPRPSIMPKASNGSTATATATPKSSLQTATPQPNSVVLNSINPTSGNFMQPITLTGQNFGTSQGYVTFYNSQGQASGGCYINSWNNTEIKAIVPNVVGNQDYSVEVKTSDNKKSNRITFTVISGQPRVDSISPTGAKIGEQVTISGAMFGSSPGSVKFYSNYPTVAATGVINSWSDTSILMTIPSGLQPGGEYGIAVFTAIDLPASVKYYTLGSN